MKTKRVIARLDIKNDALVKGIHLEGFRVLGDPASFAKIYYEDGIDEIVYMDVVASLYERNGLIDLIKKTAKEIFIPLTVGGGIRSLDDVSAILAAGADRVCINTAAVQRPELISEIIEVYGSSTLVIAVEAIKVNEEYMVFTDNGREHTGIKISEWVKKIEKLGAGEILLTSVDREGTGKGIDIELLEIVRSCVQISIVIHGGVGSAQDVYNAFHNLNADAVCVASLFHYNTIHSTKPLDKSILGNKSFLLSNKKRSDLESISVKNLKDKLKNQKVRVR
jgi:imidazole glycerol-phosphate synthase subunit HisF